VIQSVSSVRVLIPFRSNFREAARPKKMFSRHRKSFLRVTTPEGLTTEEVEGINRNGRESKLEVM
jgi:hypothetical protein